MGGEWRIATVADLQRQGVLFVEDGNHGEYRPLPDEFADAGTPFVRPDDLKDGRVDFANCDRINDHALNRVRKGKGRAGDILFTHRATVGRIARVGPDAPPFVANPGVTVWRSNAPDLLVPVYLYFFMQTPAFMNQVWAEAGNTDTFPYVSLTQQQRLTLTLPCIQQQRAIAHILGTLDDKVDLNRQMNESLEAMARALFKSWFVDFDPVRRKAEGKDPGLPYPLGDLFPARLVDSELGEIPEGWAVGRFGDMAEQLRDQENPPSFPDALFHHFSIPAFDEGQTPKSEYGASIKSLKSHVPPGVILISKLNPEIERVWMVDVRPGERAVCSTEFLVLRARSPFTRSYVYCLARSPLFRQQIEGLVTGTSKSHQRAQVESILNLAGVTPPSSIVAAFDRSADSLLTRTFECRRESRTLAALRDTLLPKLISGELRVKQAERVVGAAM